MSSFSRRDEALRTWCAQLHPDDGVDPKEDKRVDARNEHDTDRKVQQLCKQVAIAIELELSALPQTDLFCQAVVHGVAPAPNAGRVRVTLGVSGDVEIARVEAVLANSGGRLRAAVAASITRRRAPDLVFTIVGLEVCDG